MHLSKQSQKVYEFLLKEGREVPVAKVGTKLLIAPADVYRLIKPLSESGLIKRSRGYPATLVAARPNEALGLFLLAQSHWFNDRFGSQIENRRLSSKNLQADMQLEFIQGRDELMRISVDEVVKASKSLDLLRSGHEIPPDLMLAMVQAVKRGVRIRMLVQDYGDENKDQVSNWIRNGIIIRKTGIKHLRLMIYDSNIGYFMSYKHSDSGQDVGMKIVYPAFTAILSQYFEDLWRKSERI